MCLIYPAYSFVHPFLILIFFFSPFAKPYVTMLVILLELLSGVERESKGNSGLITQKNSELLLQVPLSGKQPQHLS